MDIRDRWSPIFIALTILSTVWTLIAYFNRNKYREPQQGLSQVQKSTILFSPFLLTFLSLVFSTLVPGITPALPIFVLVAMAFITVPFLRSSAEWIGVPLKIRQAANQIMYGVIITFVFLVLVVLISDIMGS